MAAHDPPFSVVLVTAPPAERRDEQLGSKAKFWFKSPEGDADLLYKRGRDNEDWSEKVAAELAHLVRVPCAQVDLAECDGEDGTVSRSFLDRSRGERLVHGNELLLAVDPGYPTATRYRVREHTVEAVESALERVTAARPDGADVPADFDAFDVFVGYLMLDAWIGNSDRHHENWAVILRPQKVALAPSFDHASSFGRNDPTEKAQARLHGRDPHLTVSGYASKCRSALYAPAMPARPLLTTEAFQRAAAMRPRAAAHWRSRLNEVPSTEVARVFARIPPTRIDPVHCELAVRIANFNRDRVLMEEQS